MKIGELARAANVTKDSIRYYLEIGLISADRDQSNGYQIFSKTMLNRLRFIKLAQSLGFHLDDIRKIFQDADTLRSPCPNVRDIIITRIAETRQRIESLTQLCGRMEDAIASWDAMSDGVPDGVSICRLIETQLSDTNVTDTPNFN